MPGAVLRGGPSNGGPDVFAWRQLAWDNAQRLLNAPTAKARDKVAREIRQHAQDKAREILHWYH